jgi:hypothetical protein
MKNPGDRIPVINGGYRTVPSADTQTLSYFIIAVLGFSFWFFMAVPFASHRETYWWLAMVHSQPFSHAFGIISSTYRPLAQGATWSAFLLLDPGIFPTSVLRQTLLQGFIYAMFLVAWWLIYSKAPQRRLFAVIACVVGGVLFPGYVHLFHIYGLFYVAVIMTLGGLLYSYGSGTFKTREVWFAVIAIILVFWHPFATALFMGFYFGYCVDNFWQRSKAQNIRALVILTVGVLAIGAMAVAFARNPMPLDIRLAGFLVSYKTNEVNLVSSVVAFLLAQTVVFSLNVSPQVKAAAFVLVSVLSVAFYWQSLPLLLLWICAALVKLLRMRCWSLFFLTLAAALLPFGGAIGTPIYALFAIILAAYVTPLGWTQAENALTVVKPGYVIGVITATAIVVVLVRSGVHVPVVTRLATPFLTERERTYQLENILVWLHQSEYCGNELAFAENAGSPIDSVESAITRRNRPPAWPTDIQLYWTTELQCKSADHPRGETGTVVVTFGDQSLDNSRQVYRVAGKYAGEATVWVKGSRN